MARSLDEMNAAHAATLLRCQKVRDDARRLDTMRAKRECSVALLREESARTALLEGETVAQQDVAAAAAAVCEGSIDRQRLDMHLASERAALARRGALARAVEEAIADVAAARAGVDAANAALLAERQTTRKRQRLANDTARIWRRALDRMQEIERENEVADTWRAA